MSEEKEVKEKVKVKTPKPVKKQHLVATKDGGTKIIYK